MAFKKIRFVLNYSEIGSDNRPVVDEDLQFYYNSYVFYSGKAAFQWLKKNNQNKLIDLLVQYGYNTDKDLVRFIFEAIDFSDVELSHKLLFQKNVRTGKLDLRNEIIEDIEKINFKGTTVEEIQYTVDDLDDGYSATQKLVAMIRESPYNYMHPEKTIAQLYEGNLRVGIVGYIESNLIVDKGYKDFLIKNSYYNLPNLQSYVENGFDIDVSNDEEDEQITEEKTFDSLN